MENTMMNTRQLIHCAVLDKVAGKTVTVRFVIK